MPRSAIRNWIEYAAVRGLAALVHTFELEQNLHTAGMIGATFHHAFPSRRARAEQNIARSFTDFDVERVRRTATRSFQHMMQVFMVDALVMPRLVTRATWTRYIQVGDLGPALDRIIASRPTLLVTGHFGNWELLGYMLAVSGYKLAAIARPLDNPLLNDWLLGVRQAGGMRILTKWGVTPVVQQVLNEGHPVGFIADQNAGDMGLFVPFFGRLASTYKSIGLLAMAHEVPIAAGCARRIGDRFRYEVLCNDFIRPEDWKDQPDPLFYITARYTRAIESMVRLNPEQYLWIHRRWKSRPRHERLGRPFPARLREKLEQLPWHTADDVEAIVEQSERDSREM